nr:MAG TPA: hypothetical protein [Microviridae sp.]
MLRKIISLIRIRLVFYQPFLLNNVNKFGYLIKKPYLCT